MQTRDLRYGAARAFQRSSELPVNARGGVLLRVLRRFARGAVDHSAIFIARRRCLPSPGAPCLTLAAALGGCAPPPPAGPTPVEEPATEQRREVYRGGAGQAGILEYHPTANHARVIDFHATPDSLWPRVIAAYQTLGLPLGEIDTQARAIGTSSQRVVGRLAGVRIGDYLDCGPGALGVRAADTYIVTLRATTTLVPVPGGAQPTTTVRTLLSGVAKANATQGDPVECVSTGTLETRLVRLIDPAARSAAPAPRTP